jgi:membrane glycosyltransferase
MSDTSVGFTTPTWFDNLPPAVRHLIFAITGALLAVGIPWFQATYTSWNLPPQILSLIGMVLPVFIAWVTPLTSQYTVGTGKLTTGADITGIPDETVPPADAVVVDEHIDPAPVDPPADPVA